MTNFKSTLIAFLVGIFLFACQDDESMEPDPDDQDVEMGMDEDMDDDDDQSDDDDQDDDDQPDDPGTDVGTETIIDAAFFNENTFISIETISATLEDGTTADCYQIVFSGDGMDGDVGPYCPPTLDDIGGLAVYDGNTNPGLRNIARSFLEDLEADGWNIVDEDGNVNITTSSEMSAPDMSISTCLELPYDAGFNFTYIIPVTPKQGTTVDVLDDTDDRGLTLDGSPIKGPPPSATEGPNGMESVQINFPSLDPCGGHPDPTGYYHLHLIPQAMSKVLAAQNITDISCTLVSQVTSGSELAGFAKDGYPIYVYAEIPDDLDECNGRTAATTEYPDGVYHYVASFTDVPNTPPCLVGVSAERTFSFQ